MSGVDRVLSCADNALRTLSGTYVASRSCPAPVDTAGAELAPEQRRLSAALMRVNHVGEVCAQALYNAQTLATDDAAVQRQFEAAARDESDHLAWTRRRLQGAGQPHQPAQPAVVCGRLWHRAACRQARPRHQPGVRGRDRAAGGRASAEPPRPAAGRGPCLPARSCNVCWKTRLAMHPKRALPAPRAARPRQTGDAPGRQAYDPDRPPCLNPRRP